MKQNTNECLYCGESFASKRIDAKYCCNSHRQLAYLKNGKDRNRDNYGSSVIIHPIRSPQKSKTPSKEEVLLLAQALKEVRQQLVNERIERFAEEIRIEEEKRKKESAFENLSELTSRVIRQLEKYDDRNTIYRWEVQGLLSDLNSLSQSDSLEELGAKFAPESYIRTNVKPFLENILTSLRESRERHIEFKLPVNFKQQFIKISNQLQG